MQTYISANDTDNEPSKRKIRSIVDSYSWKQKYSQLKEYAKAVKNRQVLTDEQLEELDYLFHHENSNAKRRLLTDSNFISLTKNQLLAKLRENDIFILSHGAIEDYYPTIEGLGNLDKPSKALKAIEYLKSQNDFTNLLPKIFIDDEPKCELEVIFEKIFL